VRLLLDTHALVWALAEPQRLPALVRDAMVEPGNEVYASAVNAWEIAIKAALGKIDFPLADLGQAVADAGFKELPMLIRHAVALQSLPQYHRDPFDRMLLAQAAQEHLSFATREAELAVYGVPIVWA
jgi:PIN domain nuclease of toxin-antitoxin system